MFDLSGTTVEDDMGVRDCLYQAATEYELVTTPDEILINMGTNKIHLYQFLIARQRGRDIDIRDFEKTKDPDTLEEALKVYHRYTDLMVQHYRTRIREIPGTSEVFRWCHHGRSGVGERWVSRYCRRRRTHTRGNWPPSAFHDLLCYDEIEHPECSRNH
jgi:beta-phosphoglucomutase-like phosphatase (HAD superfamily)